MKIGIGNRVKRVTITSARGVPVGSTGVIVTEISPYYWGIDWDNFNDGHNCYGAARPGHGYNVPKSDVELLDIPSSLTTPSILSDAEFDSRRLLLTPH